MQQRCLVGFFGITRGLAWTIESIERNIYAPLAAAGIEQVRVAHFNAPERLYAPRSGEVNVAFNVGDLGRLMLDDVLVEPQTEANIAPYLPIIMRVPQRGEADGDGATRRNALHQMFSLRSLGQIIARHDPGSFDMVLLLRPDLRYLDPLPVGQLFSRLKRMRGGVEAASGARRWLRPQVDLITPIWQKHGGINDRLAIATPAAAMIYTNRVDYLAAYCAQSSYFQTERFLAYVVAQSGLRVGDTRLRAQRIRSDGAAKEEDFAPKWRSKVNRRVGKLLGRVGKGS